MITVEYETVQGESLTKQFATDLDAQAFIEETHNMGLGAKLRQGYQSLVTAMMSQLGLDDDTLLVVSGNYTQGFWRNQLCVDLERLEKGGNLRLFTDQGCT